MSETMRLSERNALIQAMLSNAERLKDFYRFTAQNPHFDLHDACQIIVVRPNASVCFSYEEWNAMGRRITKGRKGIPYADRDGVKHFAFDANDTHGEDRYMRLIYPMKRLLIGLDKLNGTEWTEDKLTDYRKIQVGIAQYLQENNYFTDDEERNSLICEGVAYSLYCKTGFPKNNGIKLHGLPYGLKENADLFRDIYVLTDVIKEEIEEAYSLSKEEVEVIHDIDEETLSDEPVVKEEPIKETPKPIKENVKTLGSRIYQKYLDAQEQYPDSIVVERVGDFYEVFGESAKVVAEKLDLTLTGRDVGLSERVLMVGFPFHVSEQYIDSIREEHSVVVIEDNELIWKPSIKELFDGEVKSDEDLEDEQDENEKAAEWQSREYVRDDEPDEEEDDEEEYEDIDLDELEEIVDEEPQEKPKGKPIKERKRKNPQQQFSLFDLMDENKPKEGENYQENVDKLIEKILKRGSGFENGKMRICDTYSQNPTERDFADFLKKEYGIGGSGDGEYSTSHDARGISMVWKNSETKETIAEAKLKWSQVAVWIADLIDDDKYLTASEKEEYESYRAQRYGTDESRITAIADSMVKRGTRYTWNGAYNYWSFGNIYKFVLEHSDELKQELEARKEVESVNANGADFTVYFHKEYCKHEIEEPEVEEKTDESAVDLDAEEDEDWEKLIESGVLKPIERVDIQPQSENTDLNEIGFSQGELGGAKARFQSNVEAIETMKKLYRENREATPEERKILAKYVGWGGLAKAFDELDENWQNEYEILKGLLTEEEYSGAKGSVLNAHYTSKEVIDGMYSALKRFGVGANNRILEPALGTGNFFGFMPKEISENARLYGVELDTLTGKIASKLYPNANIQIKGYEQTSFTNDSFDLVVSNVPFGAYSVFDSEYAKNNFYIHDYFIAKSIDKLKPNGLMAVITSKGTMDKLNPTVRKYFADRAELIGAIRLPNNAFKTTANTEVVADILFFRKREEQINADTSNTEWLATGKTEEGYEINNYFIQHPEMVLGKFVKEHGMYGALDVTVQPDGRELSVALNEAIEKLPANFYINPESSTITDTKSEIEVDYDIKSLCYKVINDKLYMRVGDTMEEREIPKRPQDAFQRIKGMIGLRKNIREILDMQIAGCSDEQLKIAQWELNERYDRFVNKYGILNSQTNTKLFREDADSALLFACENVSEDKKTATKADIFSKRTIKAYVVPTQTDDCYEALHISMNERGKVDIAYIEELTKKDYDTVISELGDAVYRDPAEVNIEDKYSGFEIAERYLSGNVKRKLIAAQKIANAFPNRGFERNIEALEKVQPEPLTASEISVRIGASWVDTKYYKKFLMKILDIPYYYDDGVSIYFNPHDSSWRVDKSQYLRNHAWMKVHEVYGTGRASAYRLFEDCLNLRDTKIYDTIEEDGKEKRVLNQAETIAAREKQNKIREEFKDWIFSDPDRRDELVDRYNDLFNQIRLPSYDGSYLKFPEMNPNIELRPHQKDAVARISMTGDNTLLHHVVGSGKTYTMGATMWKLRQHGIARKCMFVVPNHIVQQWANDLRNLLPNAKLLVASKEDFEKENRKKFVSKVALGDWDGIIIAQSSFAKIPISAERQIKKLREEIGRIEETIVAQWENNSHPRGAVKNLERIKKNREAQLKKLMDDTKKDDVLTFESLGVDFLFVDEAHNYKNLFLFTKMNNVAGISTAASQRATDLKLKCEYINELHGGDKGVVFATGTPISNSMTEMYTMQTYLGSETLKEIGINYFDAWAADFGETVTSLEMAPSGQGYKAKTRFAKFTNLPELLTLYRSFADVQTADMVKLAVPEVDRAVITLKPSDTVIDLAEEIADRAEAISKGGVPPEMDNMLKITSDGKKLALDPRCFEPTSTDEPVSKLNECAERVYEVWNSTHDIKGTQIIFCDLSTPKKAFEDYEYGVDFDVYNDLKYKLVQKGIPAHEIAFIHEANTDNQKQALFDNVNGGKVRVLLGSTEKCGAGTNVQTRLVALHHLDTPYRPSDMQQREGRIVRQGNTNERVKIFTYVTERTFDSYSYQILENKQRFISQIDRGDLTVREAEDIDETTLTYAEIKAITAANPKIKRKMEVDTEVARLRVLEGQYKKNLYGLQDKLRKTFPEDIRRQEMLIERTRADIKVVEENYNPENFSINVNGVVYTDKKEGARALTDALYSSKPETVVAEYAGFKISMNPLVLLTAERTICLSGNGQYNVDIGQSASGNLTRIENFLTELPNREKRLVTKLEQLKMDKAVAEEEVNKPFEHAEKLASLLKEQTELNAELDLNRREEVIIDDDKDDGDTTFMALPDNNKTEADIKPSTTKKRQRKQLTTSDWQFYQKIRNKEDDTIVLMKNGDGYDVIGIEAQELCKKFDKELITEEYDGEEQEVFRINEDELDNVVKSLVQYDGYRVKIVENATQNVKKEESFIDVIDKVEEMDVAVLPDYSVDQEFIADKYGYSWKGMLPMWKRSAKRLYDLGLPIYRLNQDDTETKIENPEMIDGDGILYGIEKPDWKEFIESEKGKSYLATRYEMSKSASTLVNEELSYFDEAIIVDFNESNFLEKEALKNYTLGFTPDKQYVSMMLDEFTHRIFNDSFLYYGWYETDVTKSLAKNLENEELKESADVIAKRIALNDFIQAGLRDHNSYKYLHVGEIKDEEQADEIATELKSWFEDSQYANGMKGEEFDYWYDEYAESTVKPILMGRPYIDVDELFEQETKDMTVDEFREFIGLDKKMQFTMFHQGSDRVFEPEIDLSIGETKNGKTIYGLFVSLNENTSSGIQPYIDLSQPSHEFVTPKNSTYISNDEREFVDELIRQGYAKDTGFRKRMYREMCSLIEFDAEFLRSADKEKYEQYSKAYDEYYEANKEEIDNAPINYVEEVQRIVDVEYYDLEEELIDLPPREILARNYETHVKTELWDTLVSVDLEEEYAEALYADKDKGILNELYEDFLGKEHSSVNNGSDVMDFITDYCEEYHKDIIEKVRYKVTDENVIYFGQDYNHNAYYYFKDKLSLDNVEPRIGVEADEYIIAAPVCYLSQEYMEEHNITFLKTGRDVDESMLEKEMDYSARQAMKRAYNRKFPMEATMINIECRDDIQDYIRRNFDGMRLNVNYMSNLIEKYGIERMTYVLANTVQINNEDGRYSQSNKEWAKQVNINNENKDRRMFVINSHPAIVDGFVSAYRKLEKEHQAMEEMKGFEIIDIYSGKTKVKPTVELYEVKDQLYGRDMNGLAIQLWEVNENNEIVSPYSTVTKNFGEFIGLKNTAYIDLNNCPYAVELLKKGYAKDTGFTKVSGMNVVYPLWQFDEEFLKTIGGENYKIYSDEWDKYMGENTIEQNEEKGDEIMPENDKNNKWVIVKVSHNAMLSEQERHLFMKMPNGSEYSGYTYNIYKNRVKESRQLVDMQSDGHELCYELLFLENETVVLHKGDNEVTLTAEEFKKICDNTSDKDYEREEPKERVSFSVSREAIKGTYEKSSLLTIPEEEKYAGYGFYVPNAFIEEDKSREDGYVKITMPEDFSVTAQNRERTEKVDLSAREIAPMMDKNFVANSASAPAQSQSKDKNGWKHVFVPSEMFIKEYEKSNLMRMPEGEYDGYVFYLPRNLMEDAKDDKLKISLPPDFTIRLKNNRESAEHELSVDEFIEQVKGKKVESYQKPSNSPSEKFAERKKILDESIPQEMKDKPNWVVLRTKYNEEKGKVEKYLIDCHTNKFARSDDPTTWTDYETACKFASEHGGVTLAYALDGKDGLACIDLDHCIDDNGNYSDLAKEVLSKCGKTYIETSVSGKGLHIFGTTEGMDVRTFSKDGDMEFYRSTHFIAMTGDGASYQRFESFDKPEMKELIERKCDKRSEFDGKGAGVEGLSKMSDRDVVEKACAEKKHGATFKALYEGQDLQNNHSNSDMSLMNRLAFWCNGDKEQMLRIFQSSGLFRPDKSPDYYECTVVKAIKDTTGRFQANTTSTYKPKPPANSSGNGKR